MIAERERPLNEVIGENIKKYYEQSDFTSLTSFSRDLGLDAIRMKEIFRGERSISTDKLEKIAYALNVKPIDLVEDWSE